MDLHLHPSSLQAVPGGLQRTSDERWLTLADPRAVAAGRWHALPVEDPARLAVVLTRPPADLRARLAPLLAHPVRPVPGTRVIAPLDLLHDLDGGVVGWLVDAPDARFELDLTTFLDPAGRARAAPGVTWRHLLRAARNLALLTAAVHDAGHAGVTTRTGLRIDDRARVTLWRPEALATRAGESARQDDWRRLARLAGQLLDTPAASGPLLGLLRRGADTPSPSEWLRALRTAESALVTCTADPAHHHDVLAPTCPWCAAATTASVAAAPPVEVEAPAIVLPSPPPAAHRPVEVTPAAPRAAAVPTPSRSRRQAAPAAAATAGSRTPERFVFALATGLLVASVASVAPFGLLVAAGVLVPVAAAVRDRRRGRGRLLRMVPYGAAGAAVAAFVFLDVALLFGLVLAVAERVFDYGPGFNLRFAFDAAQVPGLVRGFAAALGALAGFGLGGETHAWLRDRPSSPRLLATPMLAVAVGVTLLATGARLAWWPFVIATPPG